MNTTLEEVDLVDAIPAITEIVRCYCVASYAEREVLRCQIQMNFPPQVADAVEWTARTLATPNRTAQVVEMLACALCGFGIPLSTFVLDK